MVNQAKGVPKVVLLYIVVKFQDAYYIQHA